jgi:hypothetical protein
MQILPGGFFTLQMTLVSTVHAQVLSAVNPTRKARPSINQFLQNGKKMLFLPNFTKIGQ